MCFHTIEQDVSRCAYVIFSKMTLCHNEKIDFLIISVVHDNFRMPSSLLMYFERQAYMANNIDPDQTFATVLPTKCDSDDMFCSQSYLGLRIDRSLVYFINPICRIRLIHK